MGFLGLTEEQVDLYQPYGNAFQKITKQRLEANMEAIIYVLSACQSFMLIIDHDYGHKVVTQKTYWTDLDKYYEMLINPEKPDVPLNKNDAFQKVQKRRVQEKR